MYSKLRGPQLCGPASYGCWAGTTSGAACAVDFMSATVKPRSIKADASMLKIYFAFCAADGIMPMEADVATIVRYVSWVADRGRNMLNASRLAPYLSGSSTTSATTFASLWRSARSRTLPSDPRIWELAQKAIVTVAKTRRCRPTTRTTAP
eukprot:jgi/Tetstr1/447655/TSEL_035013.t1